MLKYLLLFSCFLLSSSSEETIPWSDDLKLDWSYFRGQPQEDTDAVAITASGISFGYSIQKTDDKVTSFKVNVIAHFYPDKSWYKPEKSNDTILMHERLHFDITEWHARLLRKQIVTLQPTQNVSSTLDNLYADISKTLKETQNTYDAESDHSRNIEKQFFWQKKVALELKRLEKFKE